MTKSITVAASISLLGLLLGGCADAPRTDEQRQVLQNDSHAAVNNMFVTDPDLRSMVDQARGYAIFPSVGKGGFIAGGAYGRGVVYQGGNLVGYAELQQAAVGALAGGQSFRELIVFHTDDALNHFKNSGLSFQANASAIALKAGAAKNATSTNGVSVFTQPTGGLMFEASIGGQKISFQPLDTATTQPTHRTTETRTEIRTDTNTR